MRWVPVWRARRKAVAQWVADPQASADNVAGVALEVQLEMTGDPFEQLAVVADVLQYVARRIIALATAPAAEHRPAWVTHWLSAARTVARRRDARALRQALQRIPEHTELLDTAAARLRSEAGYAEALRAFVHGSLVHSRRRDLEQVDPEQARYVVRCKCASICRSGHLRVSRYAGWLLRIMLGMLPRRLRGWACCSSLGGAFVSQRSAAEADFARLHNFVTLGGEGRAGLVHGMLGKCPASAPALGGLRYGWATAGDDIARVLYRAWWLRVLGARTSCVAISRMAWASKLRLVLRVPEVRLSLARVASAWAAGLCLLPRQLGWRAANIAATLGRADHVAWGLLAELREGAGLQ